jgi:hypothetical protein
MGQIGEPIGGAEPGAFGIQHPILQLASKPVNCRYPKKALIFLIKAIIFKSVSLMGGIARCPLTFFSERKPV